MHCGNGCHAAAYRLLGLEFFVIQDACDLVCADPVKSHGKDPPYHFGCFRVDDEFSFCIWVFAVSIPCKRADEQPLFPLVVKHRADISGQIFQIPLVDQAVDLAGFLFAVSLVSTWSTTAMKRMPHSMNFPCRYFSTSSMSRVKRDCVLASTTSN